MLHSDVLRQVIFHLVRLVTEAALMGSIIRVVSHVVPKLLQGAQLFPALITSIEFLGMMATLMHCKLTAVVELFFTVTTLQKAKSRIILVKEIVCVC